jgi:uncharacterized membrane protein
MDDLTLIIFSFLLTGTLEILLGLPLMFDKIKPNWLFGFRTLSTVSNEEIWYKINRQVGKDFIIAGIILILGILFLIVLLPGISVNEITLAALFLITITVAAVIIRGFVYLKKLKDGKE